MSQQSQQTPAPAMLGEAILNAIRQAVREEIQTLSNGHQDHALLTPEELAGKLKLPVSWVYEQSRQGNIPTHRIGRYIRFDLQEVLESQAAKQAKKKSD
jgi:excisionase family DNA binding protein